MRIQGLKAGWISFLLMAAVAGGCSKQEPGKDAIAKVNKQEITTESFETKLNRIAHLPGRDYASNEKKRELLNEMINEVLLFQAALDEGIVQKSERLRREIAREYLSTKMGNERHEPGEKEIQEYYENKKNELERIRASHILIKPEKPGDPASEAAAKNKAEGLLKMIRADGVKADFAKYARENSQDESNKNRGGDLFFFDRKKMVPEFSNAAFELKTIGDVSDVVNTKFGYHIIKLTGEQRGIDFFKHSVKWQIAQEKQREKADQLFEKLRGKASIKVFDDVLAKVTPSQQMTPPNRRVEQGGPQTPPGLPRGAEGNGAGAPGEE